MLAWSSCSFLIRASVTLSSLISKDVIKSWITLVSTLLNLIFSFKSSLIVASLRFGFASSNFSRVIIGSVFWGWACCEECLNSSKSSGVVSTCNCFCINSTSASENSSPSVAKTSSNKPSTGLFKISSISLSDSSSLCKFLERLSSSINSPSNKSSTDKISVSSTVSVSSVYESLESLNSKSSISSVSCSGKVLFSSSSKSDNVKERTFSFSLLESLVSVGASSGATSVSRGSSVEDVESSSVSSSSSLSAKEAKKSSISLSSVVVLLPLSRTSTIAVGEGSSVISSKWRVISSSLAAGVSYVIGVCLTYNESISIYGSFSIEYELTSGSAGAKLLGA